MPFFAVHGGRASCKDNVLSKCNAQGTMYEETICGSKVCSEKHGSCDLCAQFKECDGDVVVECDATGQGYTRNRCASAVPRCRDGRCVECVWDSDCASSSNSCEMAYCELGTNTCETRVRFEAACTHRGSGQAGYCDSVGSCIQGSPP